MATIAGRLTFQIYYFGVRSRTYTPYCAFERARGSLLFVIPRPAMCYQVLRLGHLHTHAAREAARCFPGPRGKSTLKNVTAVLNCENARALPTNLECVLSRGEPHRHLVDCQTWLMTDRNCATIHAADYESWLRAVPLRCTCTLNASLRRHTPCLHTLNK